MLYSILVCLSRADLRVICLVYSHLRTLVELYLYSEIRFDWEKFHPPPITSLLRSILRRPQLATYVCRVSLAASSFDWPGLRGKAPKVLVSKHELEEPLAFVAKAKVAYRDAWLEELRNGTMDAYVAVLLS